MERLLFKKEGGRLVLGGTINDGLERRWWWWGSGGCCCLHLQTCVSVSAICIERFGRPYAERRDKFSHSLLHASRGSLTRSESNPAK